MIMKLKLLMTALITLAFFSSPLTALELINGDSGKISGEIITGESKDDVVTFELNEDESIPEICLAGCKIRLSNGAEKEFTGDEIVEIREGKFVIDE